MKARTRTTLFTIAVVIGCVGYVVLLFALGFAVV